MSYQFQKLTGVEEISKSDFSEAKVLITNENKTVLKQVPVGDVGTVVSASEDKVPGASDLGSITVNGSAYNIPDSVVANPDPISATAANLTGLKVAGTDYKIAPVEANPTEETTEELTTIKIDNTSYKIKGLPDGTTAGQALVYDGSDWTKQDGYGYCEEGKGNLITWSGDTTDRDSIEVTDMGILYKISDLMPTKDDLNGATIITTYENYAYTISTIVTATEYATSIGGSISAGDGDKLLLAQCNQTIGLMVATAAQTITVTQSSGSLSIVVPSTGIYVGYTSSAYWKTLIYGNQITWDGDIENKPKIEVDDLEVGWYKISEDYVRNSERISNPVITRDEDGEIDVYSATVYDFDTVMELVEAELVSGDASKLFVLGEDDLSSFWGIHAIISAANLTVIVSKSGTQITFEFEKGTYLYNDKKWYPDEAYYTNVLNYVIPNTVNKIDSKYIPTKLPEATTAGTALIYNGSEWTNQTGYGYETISGATWNGDTTGKTSFGDSHYLVSSTYISATDIVGYTLGTMFDGTSSSRTITADDISTLDGGWRIIGSLNNENAGLLLVIASDGTLVQDSTTLAKGLWLYRHETNANRYVKNVSKTTYVKIDSKYMPSTVPTITIASSQITSQTDTGMEISLTESQLELLFDSSYATYFISVGTSMSAYMTKGKITTLQSNGAEASMYLDSFKGTENRIVYQASITNSTMWINIVELATYDDVSEKSTVSVSSTGTSTNEVNYITVDNTEYKLATGASYTAGTNIQISDANVISATDTTYTAGTNIDITNNVISATDTTYSAGTNIQINGTTISATDTTYSEATTSAAGLMSTTDKSKLDNIAENATNVSVSSTGSATDEIKYITVDGVEKKIASGTSYTAGTNIQIDGTTISATDTTYSAGSGLSLTGTTFSADTTVLQSKLVSGTDIKTINNESILGSGNIAITVPDVRYLHNIGLYWISTSELANAYANITILSTNSTELTFNGLGSWLVDKGYNDGDVTNYYTINGMLTTNTSSKYIYGIRVLLSDTVYTIILKCVDGTEQNILVGDTTIKDKVVN